MDAELVDRSFKDPHVRRQNYVEWYADLVALSQVKAVAA